MKAHNFLPAGWLALLLLVWISTCRADQAMEALKGGVVRIRCGSETGTGFIVSIKPEMHYVVTASHVVKKDEKIEVEYFHQPGNLVEAQILSIEEDDPLRGLAVLTVKRKVPQGVTSLPFAADALLKDNEDVQAIGFPAGAGPWSVVKGTFNGQKGRMLLFQGPFNGGLSGSPILRNGEVVALTVTEQQGFGRAVSAASVEEFLRGARVSVSRKSTEDPSPPTQVRSTPSKTDGPIAARPPTPTQINLTGQYVGRSISRGPNGESYTCDFETVMWQQGNSVSGEYRNTCGDAGSFLGQLSGSVLTTQMFSNYGYNCKTSGTVAQMGASISGRFGCSNGLEGTSSMSRR